MNLFRLRRMLSFLPLLVVLPLAGCIQDTASYALPEKDHAITLIRNQTWFWQDTLSLDVVAVRLPDCNAGMRVRDVKVNADIALSRAPDEYPEPIFILRVDQRHFAVSTRSCQVQEFQETPPDLGTPLGHFKGVDGKFAFVP